MPIITPNLAAQYEGYGAKEDREEPTIDSPPEAPQPSAAESHEDDAHIQELRRQYGLDSQGKNNGVPASKPSIKSSWATAGQPVSADQPEIGAGEAVIEAFKNFRPSAVGAAKSFYEAVRHPVDTAKALGNVGEGAYSQITDALGLNQDDAVSKEKKQAALKIIEDHYKNTYGSTQGFLHAFSKDPFGILMDASTVLGGYGLVGKVASEAGMISKAGQLAKTGAVASRIGNAIDPIQGALWAAKKTVGAPVSLLRGAAAKTSGLTSEEQQLAFAAGASRNPANREAFNKFYRGEGAAEDYLKTAENAINKARAEKTANYVNGKGALAQGPVDLTGASNAVKSNYNKLLSQGAPSGWENLDQAHNDLINKIDGVIADPSRHGMESVDALKRQINELRSKYRGNTTALAHIDNAYKEVRNALISKDPKYASLMEDYQDSLRHIDDAKSFLGAGNKASATNSMRRAMKKSMTGTGKVMMDEMSKHEPTLPYMLAGAASNPAHGGVMRDIFDAAVSAGLYHVNPLLSVIPAIGAAPKIVGGANYYVGRALSPAARVVEPIASVAGKAGKVIGTKSPYYAGTIKEETGIDPAETGYNVGNIRDNAGGFRSYETPEAAAAAVTHNLRSYPGRFNGGKPMTLREIANHWAPRKDNNDPNAWARNVALTAGVDPDQPIDQNDTSLMQRILKGVHVAEHGQKKLYPDEVYARAAGPSASASGGRIERASGGKVDGAKHERIVNKLMAMANKAKKVTDKTTESLLDEPDESIVKALNVAQQAI